MNLYLVDNQFKPLPEWLLNNKGLIKIISSLETDGGVVKLIGGAVRAIIRNEKKPENIDLVTDLTPDKIIKCLQKSKIKFFSTNMKYGIITAIFLDEKVEISTLRIDLKTFGRQANVKFSDSWLEDAKRRDFFLNAVYMDFSGNIYDPLNGIDDLKKGQVRFIGSALKRISEDYLRMLRYVRFSSFYKNRKVNGDDISAIKANIRNVSKLSKERIINELKSIFIDRDQSLIAAKIMRKTSLDKACFQSKFNTNNLNFIDDTGIEVDWLIRIFSLTYDNEDVLKKYPLSNKERKYWNEINRSLSKDDIKKLLSKNWKVKAYQIGKFAALKLALALMNNIKISNRIRELLDYNPPTFPVKAKHLIEKGFKPGKKLGKKLLQLEKIWCNSNFSLNKNNLLNFINEDI